MTVTWNAKNVIGWKCFSVQPFAQQLALMENSFIIYCLWKYNWGNFTGPVHTVFCLSHKVSWLQGFSHHGPFPLNTLPAHIRWSEIYWDLLNLNLKSSFPSSYLSFCTMFFQQFSPWHLLPFQGWAPVLKSCRWQLYISNKNCISLHLLFTFNSVSLSFPSHLCMYHII